MKTKLCVCTLFCNRHFQMQQTNNPQKRIKQLTMTTMSKMLELTLK
jgi:hypothetical protein